MTLGVFSGELRDAIFNILQLLCRRLQTLPSHSPKVKLSLKILGIVLVAFWCGPFLPVASPPPQFCWLVLYLINFCPKKETSFFWVGFGEKTQALFDQFESQKMALAEKGAVRQRGDGVKSR